MLKLLLWSACGFVAFVILALAIGLQTSFKTTPAAYNYQAILKNRHSLKQAYFYDVIIQPAPGHEPTTGDLESIFNELKTAAMKKLVVFYFLPKAYSIQNAFASCSQFKDSTRRCNLIGTYNPKGQMLIDETSQKIIGHPLDWCRFLSDLFSKALSADKTSKSLDIQLLNQYQITPKQHDELFTMLGVDACNF